MDCWNFSGDTNYCNPETEIKMQKGRIVILGGGESGVGAAILATAKGFDVFLSDAGKLKDTHRDELNSHRIAFEEGGHTEDLVLNATEVIKSPGIPSSNSLVKKITEKNIPVISEIEFAGRYTSAKKICITGSNGKTTTTLLTYHLLKKGGLNVGLAGNIGYSFAKQVAYETFDYYVLELSSFQLDDMFAFKADIAVLLNITPDHLDRYDYDMRKYAASKFRITHNQQPEDVFIYCADDEETIKELQTQQIIAQRFPFSIKKKQEPGAFLSGEEIHIHINPTKTFTMTLNELALQGKHNIYNSMAAAITAKVLELKSEAIRDGLADFKNVEHRLEHVAKIQGVEFINDSKATNVNSVWYALESMTTPVVLIMGGVDKGNDYSILKSLVKQKVKAIVCLGKDNARIHEAFTEDVEVIINTFSAKDAVQMAYHIASSGDTVLLSPACSSFDLFNNYEDRGKQFKEAVKEL